MSTTESANWDEVYERLNKRLDEGYPPAWMHEGEVGAQLIGTVVGVQPSVPTQFGPCPVVTIETRELTRFSLWLTHTVLRREFVRQRPAAGELIAVRYEGEVRPEGGGPAYENYTVVVDRPLAANADWDKIASRYGIDEEADPDDDRRPLEQRTESALGGSAPPPAPGDEDIPF